MTGPILVAGDVHLGAENADADAFDAFLDGVADGTPDAARLVLLGDVWDLVRRDPFGLAWETSETLTRLKRIAASMPVHVVVGNHDTYLRNLDPGLYDVALHEELVLESGDHSVRFRHGESFDALQFEALSRRLSGPGDRGDIDPTGGRKDPVVARARSLVQGGKRRLRGALSGLRGGAQPESATFPRRERRAHRYLERIPEDKLVYGHTHSPYVRPDNSAANPGSWKVTAPLHNTYLRIADGEMRLYRHHDGGSDEAVDAASLGAATAATDRPRDDQGAAGSTESAPDGA